MACQGGPACKARQMRSPSSSAAARAHVIIRCNQRFHEFLSGSVAVILPASGERSSMGHVPTHTNGTSMRATCSRLQRSSHAHSSQQDGTGGGGELLLPAHCDDHGQLFFGALVPIQTRARARSHTHSCCWRIGVTSENFPVTHLWNWFENFDEGAAKCKEPPWGVFLAGGRTKLSLFPSSILRSHSLHPQPSTPGTKLSSSSPPALNAGHSQTPDPVSPRSSTRNPDPEP